MSGLPQISEKIDQSTDICDIEDGSTIELNFISFEKEPRNKYGKKVKNVTFNKCIFSQKTINEFQFHHCHFKECLFNGTIIDSCEFHQCKIIDSCFYKAGIKNTYIDPQSFTFNNEWHKKWPNVNAWLFQNLYKNSKNMHQEVFAMHADNRFLFYRRYEYLHSNKRNIKKFTLGLAYDKLLGNGYGIINVLFVTATMIITFAYLINGQTETRMDQGFLNSLYFAIVSFTTVGYGDISPVDNGIALALTMAFLIISIIWCSLVTAIIVKRIVK